MRLTSLVFALSLIGGVAAAQQQEPEFASAEPFDGEQQPLAAVAPSTGVDAPQSELSEIVPPMVPMRKLPGESSVIRNDDVIEMTAAGFGARTIVAAIAANETAFDVTPRALLALKRAGVADRVIEEMLATKRETAAPAASVEVDSLAVAAAGEVPAAEPAAAPAPAATAPSAAVAAPVADAMSPEALAALSKMIEQLAAAPAPAAAAEAPREPTAPAASTAPKTLRPEPQPENPHAPRAWVADGGLLVPIAPTVAKVAYTDMKRPAPTAFKTLQSFTGKALAFANPAMGAAASGLGELFRKDDPAETAVWALLGSASTRPLEAGAAFEVDFSNVPGVDPDRYQPAIVQLVPTSDNFRLVGAAKTEGSEQAAAPAGPIIEEPVAADLIRRGRGRYRVALGGTVPAGEYALVLRPIEERERGGRRRNADSSLGELMGANATSQIIYLTWDFSIEG